MKKKVYDFIAQYPCSTAQQCAQALQIADLEVLKLIHELRAEGYLKSKVLPLGNAIDADTSNFYSICKAHQDTERITT